MARRKKVQPASKQATFKVVINQYDDSDPVYLVNAVAQGEAVLKAVTRFVSDYPGVTIEDVEASEDGAEYVVIP